MRQAAAHWPVGSGLPPPRRHCCSPARLVNPAQLPLQTWLPDVMAGPTPVSALIHAATMTAGVYLIARTHVLYGLAPPVQTAVAVIGALTLLLAGFSSAQSDRFVPHPGLLDDQSVGLHVHGPRGRRMVCRHLPFPATHAFLKALLFLSAGVVVQRLGEEHDIFKMGGLRHRLPLAFWSFLIGSISLAALPLIDAGFYSKDHSMGSLVGRRFGPRLRGPLAIGWRLTDGDYIFRAVFVVFFGPLQLEPTGPTGWRIAVPLVVLSILALVGGFVEIPPYLGNVAAFSRLMQSALPAPPAAVTAGSSPELMLSAIAALVAVLGVAIAYVAFRRRPAFLQAIVQSPAGVALQHFWETGWGFDWLYDRVLVRPFLWLARKRSVRFRRQLLQRRGFAEPSGLSATQRIRDRSRAPVRGRDHGGLHCSHCDPGVRMILLWLILTPLIGGLLAGAPVDATTAHCRAGCRSAVWRSISC